MFKIKKLFGSLFRKDKIFSDKEYQKIVQQMDEGNFNFDTQTWNKMLKMWMNSSETNPMPSKLRSIYQKGDAQEWNSKESIELYYQLPNAFAYEQVNKEQYYIFLESLENNAISFANKTVIDVGCGIATLLSVIHEKYPTCTCIGIDYALNALKQAKRKHPYIEFVNENFSIEGGGLMQPLFGKGDVVISSFTIEHLQDPAQTVKNLLKLKKKGGILCISVPNGEVDRPKAGDKHSHHVNFWDIVEFERFLKDICHDQGSYKIKTVYMHYKNYVSGKAILAIITD